jgi:A/G-specific adenine glycosylase
MTVMSPPSREPSSTRAARDSLHDWYRPRAAAYPWRRKGSDPGRAYEVLVSEVMLQQTQAARVARAFPAFIERFPGVRALASASRADVVRAWGTLGYPRRAIALHAAAVAIVREHGGSVPRDPRALRSLPGVGEYTAAAVASLAFGEQVAAIDTNVRRIWARVAFGAEPGEVAAARIRGEADRRLDRTDPVAWNQALMDLGRHVCRPVPRCEVCPIASWCAFVAAGRPLRPPSRRQAPFEGSMRQVRGAVLRSLRERSPRTIGGIAAATGRADTLVAEAVAGLHADGVVVASPAARTGSQRGKVRLPE